MTRSSSGRGRIAGLTVACLGRVGEQTLRASGAHVIEVDDPSQVLLSASQVTAVICHPRWALGPAGLLARARAAGIDVPIIVLATGGAAAAAWDQGAEAVAGCELSLISVLVRVARPARTSGMRIGADGRLNVDLLSRDARGPEGPAGLTRLEFDILACLARRPSQVVSVEVLASACWPQGRASCGAVAEAVRRLRVKLDNVGGQGVLRTHRGVGWSVRAYASLELSDRSRVGGRGSAA